MSDRGQRPPWLSSRLLALAASPDERSELLADLANEMTARAATSTPREARRWYHRQAMLSLGPLIARRLSVRRRMAAARSGAGLDFRLAMRMLRASPGFAAAVVAMLGLAIGAHTVVYAVVDGLSYRPLPFGERSARLVTLHSTHPTLAQDWDDSGISYADLLDFRREASSLERLEAAIDRNLSLSAGNETVRVLAASVTPGLFGMLGVAPMLGRDFHEGEAAEPGLESVAIVSHGLWQSLFGGDERAVGRTARVNGRALEVIGVMPPGFTFPDGNQLWLPYRGSVALDHRDDRGLLAIGLRRPGVSLEQARSDVVAAAGRLAERYPQTNRNWGAQLFPIRDFFVSGHDATALLAAVSLLLLVACANVSGLIIARGAGRRQELIVRAALGSGRIRLVRLLMIEIGVLVMAGGATGILLAEWGVRALLAWIPEPPPYWATPAVDARVLVFALAVTGGVALASGLLPALRLSRVDGTRTLAAGTRGASASQTQRRAQQILVAAQVAVGFALLVGGLLLGRSATALLAADGGFDPRPLLSLRFYIAGDQYDQVEARAALVQEIVRRVRAVPGVEGAGTTGAIPTDDGGGAVRLTPPAGRTPEDEIGAQATSVTSGFWPTLGLDLVEGRNFTATEESDPSGDAVIVNRRLAARFWPGQSAVGRTLHIAGGADPSVGRVVGVAPDLVYEEFGETTPQSELMVYLPYVRTGARTHAVLVRASGDPGTVADAVRSAVRSVDPDLAVYDMLTMTDRRAFNHWADRFIGRTFSVFALATLLLSCIGAYGIAAYGVAQRRREIGIRLAVGADRASILRLFLAGGFRVAAVGALLGLPLALATARALQGELFRVSPWVGPVWIGPPAVLVLAVVAASYLPARRASRTDPVGALRYE
jgi:predicted permease